MGAAPDVSLCIITYRRPEGLARLLRSIERLKRPTAVNLEVVIVDNDADSTQEATPNLGDIPVRRFRQSENQIAGGRNRTVSEARGRWVAFVDDDEELHEDWLLAFHQASEDYEGADGFLGPVEPRFEQPGPTWLDASTFYARAQQRTGTHADPRQSYIGNTWLRRSLFEEVAFHSAFDRTGGEDADLLLQLDARGAVVLWCQEAKVFEWIPPFRHTARWLLRRSLESGCAHASLLRRHGGSSTAFYLLRSSAVAAAMLLATPFAALSGRRRGLQALRKLCLQLGRLAGYAGWRLEREGR